MAQDRILKFAAEVLKQARREPGRAVAVVIQNRLPGKIWVDKLNDRSHTAMFAFLVGTYDHRATEATVIEDLNGFAHMLQTDRDRAPAMLGHASAWSRL